MKSNVHNRLIRYIQTFGVIKNKTYNSDKERANKEVMESDDDEVLLRRLKQQLEAKNHAVKELEAGKITQQERIHELQTNATKITADQQRNLAQLKDSLSFSAN
eukprot:979908_1